MSDPQVRLTSRRERELELTTERMLWMDVVRGEMVLLIIVFHSTSLLRYAEVPSPRDAIAFNRATEPYWMPTLSFLGGMLADQSMEKGACDFFEGKVRTVLYPFALWSVVHGVTFRMPANSASAVRLATGGSYLFFLLFLFAFNAGSYPIRRLHPGMPAAAALAIGAVAPSRWPDVPDRFTERFWYLLAMFMLGRWASRSPDLWERIQASSAWTSSAVAATLAASVASMKGKSVYYRWEWAWSPALALVLFARAAQTIEGSSASRPLRFVGRNSIVFYTTHFPIAYGSMLGSKSRGVRSGRRALLTALTASVGVPVAVVLARERSRLVRRLFSI